MLQSRLLTRCEAGVTTRHRIPFETNNPVHARFDKNEAVNTWSISARTLRQLMEQHVGGGADLLDIHTDEENVNFTYFTEKPMTGDGWSKPFTYMPSSHDGLPFTTLTGGWVARGPTQTAPYLHRR